MLQRVLRSEELAVHGSRPDPGSVRIRERSLATTVGEPALRCVPVGRHEVLLARMPSGEVVAFATHCPHQGTPLRHATIFEACLRCPQHNYIYDLHTGRNILPTRDARPDALLKLKPGYLETHRVEERDGWIWVEEAPNPAPDPAEPVTTPLPAALAPVRRPPPQRPTAVERAAERVEARVGDDVVLSLNASAIPGHIWHVEVSGADVAVLGESYEPEPEPSYRVRLHPRETGRATVRCVYRKPWGGPPREIRTFALDIAPAPHTRSG